jgi:hypothetical protein
LRTLIPTTAVFIASLGLLTMGCDVPLSDDPRGEHGETHNPSRNEIERFGAIELPASARDIDSEIEAGGDVAGGAGDEMLLRFSMEPRDLETFVKQGHFRAGFEKGFTAVLNWRDGWTIEEAERVIGLHEPRNPPFLAREVAIDLDDPGVSVVYMRVQRTRDSAIVDLLGAPPNTPTTSFSAINSLRGERARHQAMV